MHTYVHAHTPLLTEVLVLTSMSHTPHSHSHKNTRMHAQLDTITHINQHAGVPTHIVANWVAAHRDTAY